MSTSAPAAPSTNAAWPFPSNRASVASAASAEPVAATPAVLSPAWLAANLRAGERYAGVILDAAGVPTHHLILLPGDVEMPWADAAAWAEGAGGALPTRAEQAVLFGNAKSEFKRDYYWSGEQHAANDDCAWLQLFLNGNQNDGYKSAQLRARAVRRLPIQ